MKEFKGAIFDLDGTIIDSMDVWETIDIKFLEKRNITMPNDYIEKINSMSFEEVAKYTIERFNLNESVDSLIKEWNDMAIYEYSNNIKLKPNVKEYLVKLKKHDIKIGLATSSPKELYEPVLKNNKVYDYFDHLSVTEQYTQEYLKNGSGAESMEEWLFTRELQALIQETVNRMSPQRQLVYRMSREKGLSNEEIALRLNISKRTVENHLTAALGILRKVIYVWILLTIS